MPGVPHSLEKLAVLMRELATHEMAEDWMQAL